MASLIEIVSRTYGSRAKEFVSDILHAFDLPLPASGEFYFTPETKTNISKQIIFLERMGIAFRFYDPCKIPVHDHILQPLHKIETPEVHFDIVPIVETGIKPEDCMYLMNQLRQDGIVWDDELCHNAGYLPIHEDDEFGFISHPVIVDVCDTIYSYTFAEKDFSIHGYCMTQREMYEPLMLAASRLFQNTVPDCGKEFFTACREFLSKKNFPTHCLKTSFEKVSDDGQTEKAYCAASSYQMRLAQLHLI